MRDRDFARVRVVSLDGGAFGRVTVEVWRGPTAEPSAVADDPSLEWLAIQLQ